MGGILNEVVAQKGRKNVQDQRNRAQDILEAIQLPDFDFSKITPEDYKVLAQYEPEVATYVLEKSPELVKMSADGSLGREAQMEALSKYRNLAKSGEDIQSRLMTDRALQDSAIQNQGQQATIQDAMARRGMSGSGMDFAAQLMAQQGSAQTATRAAQDRAMNAYQTRLDALKQGASLGGQVRDEDIALDTMNTGRTNDFNQRYAANQNAYNQYASGLRNDAQQQNMNAAQQTANQNVQQRNQGQMDYQNRYNELKQQEYMNQADKQKALYGNQNNRIQELKDSSKSREKNVAAAAQSVKNIIGSFYGKPPEKEQK